MKNVQNERPGSTQESVRLELGELISLADGLAQQNTQLRKDGRRILDDILARLEAQCTPDDTKSRAYADADRITFYAERRELQASWLRVDSLIDDMLSSAADELFQFATLAEARIRVCERAVYHRDARS
ncbi:MAG: hypothetical protein GWP62_13100 [Gammaproteobacteria bacterium]|jgi:hypothetical protein|nr:hypothetical protein [Gammaproteobacteria bacterium]